MTVFFVWEDGSGKEEGVYNISWDFLRENIITTTIAKPKRPKIFKSPQNISSSVPNFMATTGCHT
jgi:hypothetical protein